MKYLLVEWVKDIPKQYSVVSLDQLVDNSHRCQPEQTVGKIVQIVWTRGKIYPGLVLKIGKLLFHNICIYIYLG